MSEEVFTHHPLDLSQQQSRLLKILPTNTIELEIRHFEQSDQPYRALSYTWGDPNDQRDISINNKPFPVRTNLWSFLDNQRVDNEAYAGWYWIDALCIDQTNIPERNQQVQRMTQIYAEASEVQVWLGEADHSSGLVLKQFSSIVDMAQQEVRVHPPRFVPEDFDNSDFRWALYQFDQRPYWRRIWIIQEFILASNLVIQCGRERIGWVSFWTLWLQIRNQADPLQILHQFNNLGRLRSEHQQGAGSINSISLSGWNWITCLREAECTDFRDRCYGLQGVIEEKYRIEVDYSKSLLEIYFEILKLVPRVADQLWSIQKHIEFSEELRQYLRLEEVELFLLKRIYKGEIFVTKSLKGKTSRAGRRRRTRKDWDPEDYLEFVAGMEKYVTG